MLPVKNKIYRKIYKNPIDFVKLGQDFRLKKNTIEILIKKIYKEIFLTNILIKKLFKN
jgi:hypothetical protein